MKLDGYCDACGEDCETSTEHAEWCADWGPACVLHHTCEPALDDPDDKFALDRDP